MNVDYYRILNVARDADVAAIRSAYRRTALIVHPDKGGSEELFHLVTAAFETLSHKSSRQAYDLRCGLHHSRHHTGGSHAKNRRGTTCEKERGLKRRCCGYSFPVPKRSTARPRCGTRKARQVNPWEARKAAALKRLQNVLRSMDAEHRKQAMALLDLGMRRMLLAHMESEKHKASKIGLAAKEDSPTRSAVPSGCPSTEASENKLGHTSSGSSIPKSGAAGVHKLGTLYRASISVANMELHARFRQSLAAALDDHIVLMQIRGCLAGVLNNVSQSSTEAVVDKCKDCCQKNRTSMDAIQLRAKVRVRASNLAGTVRVSSAELPLAEALAVRARLLSSRQQSWAAFRTEWLSVMQRRQIPSHQMMEAVDRAWLDAEARRKSAEHMQERLLKSAVRSLKDVLNMEAKWAAEQNVRSTAAERRRCEREKKLCRERLFKWSRKRDLTMDEIIQGPPPAFG